MAQILEGKSATNRILRKLKSLLLPWDYVIINHFLPINFCDATEAEVQALEIVESWKLERSKSSNSWVVTEPQSLQVGVAAKHPSVNMRQIVPAQIELHQNFEVSEGAFAHLYQAEMTKGC